MNRARRKRRLLSANFYADRYGTPWSFRLYGYWLDESEHFALTGELFAYHQRRRI